MKPSISIGELVRLHHQVYEEDIPFWVSRTGIDSPVLELGCGHGRITIPLAKRGRKVIGVDQDWQALLYLDSQLKLQTPELGVHILLADMLHFHCLPIFGSIILPCNTFSTFKKNDRIKLLERIIRMLRPGGSFIVSIPNPEQVLMLSQSLKVDEVDQETQFIHPESGFPVQVSSRGLPTQEGMIWEWIYDLLLPDGNVERFIQSIEHYPSSLEVYRKEFKEAGFIVDTCLGDFSGTEYHPESPYLILIGKSPRVI
jgi:SAM-dependent methyltransferase